MRGRKGKGWWAGLGVPPLAAAVGWKGVVMSHRALEVGW